jgi:beta-lactamase regulating signal transducer with metallopeptidase domain
MMSAEMMHVLTSTVTAVSIAIVLIGLLRKPLQAVVGARVAYWLWLLAPVMLAAALLPPPPAFLFVSTNIVPEQVSSAFAAVTMGHPMARGGFLTHWAIAIWSVGAVGMLLLMAIRQRSFVQTLGVLTPDPGGFYRGNVAAPVLVGLRHQKIVVPADFESRYSAQECELILAHERAHASRHDVAANTFASFALCLHWFNPLMYRAVAWLRMDQELACDALVLAHWGNARRRYAEALLRTQLATESVWRLSTGCHWQSIHPLKDRIAMLERLPPTRTRRVVGLAFITALAGAAAYATWASESPSAAGPAILVDLDVKITNPQTHDLNELTTQYLVHSGESIPDTRNDGTPLQKTDRFVACTPYLSDVAGKSSDWSGLKARGIPMPAAGQILLDCRIYRDGEIGMRPSVIAQDGSPAILEFTEPDGAYHYRLEVTATTSPEKIVAAVKRAAERRGGPQ